jgi:hypothetical protein
MSANPELVLIDNWRSLNTVEVDSDTDEFGDKKAPGHCKVLYAHFTWWVLQNKEWWRQVPRIRLFKESLIKWQKTSQYGFEAGLGSKSIPLTNGTTMTPLFNLGIKEIAVFPCVERRDNQYLNKLEQKVADLEEKLAKTTKVADLYKQLCHTLQ